MIGELGVAEESAGDAGSAAVTAKSARGALALGSRQVLVQGLNVLGGIVLARLLSPAEFGLYAIITFIAGFLVVFGDVGLGASLVRQPEEPAVADYQAIFTAQQVLVLFTTACFWAVAPWIVRAYSRPPEEVWIFRMVALSLLFTSCQTIAAIQLERHLAFGKLAAVEMAQATVFNVLAVGLAWRGMGVVSLPVALLARSAVGAILANLVSPWPIGLRMDWERVRSHFQFGLAYQGAHLVNLLKDSITPIMVGLLLGAAQVGYINWAQMLAAYPVLALMALNRLYLPAFSRMQAYPNQLGQFIERVLRATNLVVAPLAVLTLVLAVPITQVVFGEKWLPALPLFYLLWIANLFVPTATPLMGVLNALGQSQIALRFAVGWMAGTWLLGAPLIVGLGTIGFAIGNVAIVLTNLVLFRVVRSRIAFRLLIPVLPPWGVAAAMGFILWLVGGAFPPSTFAMIAVYAACGGLLYVSGIVILDRRGAIRVWSWFRTDVWPLAFR